MELNDLEYEVRTFYDFDLEDVIDIVAAEPSRAYQGEDITGALHPGPPGGHFGYVTIQDITDRIIGWLKAQPEPESSDTSRLRLNVIVVPDQRRRGVGTAMLKYFLEDPHRAGVKEISAVVRRGEDAAIAFLARNGFEPRLLGPSDGSLEYVRRLDD
jgi:GNAT superfamily N-acetyltransferase